MRYRAFRTKKDGLFYFQFLTEEGDSLLRSQPYQDKNACFNGIKSVIANSADADRYEKGTDDDGKHYFILKAANGQEIGRSISYETTENLDQAIAFFQTEGPNASSKSKEKEGESKQESAPGAEDGAAPAAPAAPANITTTNASASEPKSGGGRTDDYKPLAFYQARISGVEDGFDTFYHEEGNEYYFTYNLDKLILLISEGYQSEGSRNNGINSVTKNLPIPQRYQRKEHPNGKSYFNLRAGNNQEIATSIWFDSADQMEVVIGLLTQGIGTGGGKISAALGLADSDAIYPEYRPLQFYEERIEGTEFGFDAFTDEEEKDYFTVNFEAKPILISEIYQSAAARDNGIRSVKKNVKNEKRYERKRHPNGNHYFNLLAGNKQEIATSIWFAEEKEMEKAIRWLLSTGGTRRRKKAKRTTQAAERRYLQQGLKYMCSEITYDTFQSGGNQRFYFLFKTKESKVVLINGSVRGFATEEELNEGITKLLKYAPNKKNYHEQTTKTGKVYFYIKDEDGNNVGRSSLFYDTADQMNAAIDLLACGAGIPAAAAAPAASKDKVIDDYLPCEAYAGETGFHKFFNEEKNEHYFSYNRASDGKTMLRSEGYTTEAARDNGIRSVIKNAPLEERWRSEAVLNGKYFCYLLRAGNNQEIARSCYYSDSADMQADFDWIRGGESTIGLGSSEVNGMLMSAAMLQAEEDAKKKPVLDDYLPCEAYAGEKGGFHTFFDEEKKEYYFSFIDDNGDVALRSEGYTTAAARDNGIASVKKNAPVEERWKKDTALNGRYHFYLLKAGNNQEIARSCYYEDEAAMLAAWGWVRGENSTIGIGSGLVNGALMSAAMIRAKDAEEEAARLAAEAEAKRKAEEEAARLAAEEEAKRKAEEEAARLAAEAEAKRKPVDDYLPCEAYNGEPGGFHTFYNEEKKEYYFSFIDDDGNVVLRSEGYTTAAARDNGIESVKKNAPIEERWKKETALNGRYHYYLLKAGNNQEIARSCYYEDEAAMLAAWGWVRGDNSPIGIGSALVGGALFSAAMIRARDAEAETARLAAELEAKQKAEAEAARLAAEAEAKRKAEEEAARLAAEAEAKRKAEEEAARLAAEAEAKRKEEAAAAALLVAQAEAKRKAEEEAALLAAQAEAKRKEEAEKAALLAAAKLEEEEKKKKAALAAAAAAAAATAATNANKEETTTYKEEKRGGLGWLWWLLGLLLLALLLFWLLKGCDGCNTPTATPPPVAPVDTTETISEAPVEEPEPYGADCEALGLSGSGSLCDMANYLSAAGSTFPNTFGMSGVSFAKNSDRLNRDARKYLDDMVTLLNQYPDATVDIYGYIDDTERSGFGGNKELTLDDVRARNIHDYLIRKGIDARRMNFSGEGSNDTRQPDLIIRGR